MYKDIKVLDVHGHMTTPDSYGRHSATLVALNSPWPYKLEDAALEGALQRHLKVMDDRAIDVQCLGPRPINMFHWMRPHLQDAWCRTTNDVIAQTVRLHPDRFLGMAQLPQVAELDTNNCVAELERCMKDLGFVGAYLNPDPDGRKTAPGVHDPYWYPLYEKAQELGAVLMVHPSTCFDRRLEALPHNYQINNVTEEYIATQLYSRTDVFARFPGLKVIVCHAGGSLDRWVRADHHMAVSDLSNNLFFDLCVYEDWFLKTAIKQRGIDQVLFGTEAPGSGGSPRPDTGRPSDDLVPVIDSIDFLTHEDKVKIFNANPKRVFPRLATL
ncbi:MAG TPA: amidohydrolase family protein [Chloroflexota bacterium]|nr:amidohydrolase family protein [Chloroflexota bacterium]